MDDIICIYKTYSTQEADLLKSRLMGNGIQCFLRSDNAGGVLPHLTALTGIGVMVSKDDAEDAIAMIYGDEEIGNYEDDMEIGCTEPQVGLSLKRKLFRVISFCLLFSLYILPLFILLFLLIYF